MAEMKAFLVINKYVKMRDQQLIEGVFWKRKNAKKYARKLIEKTGNLKYTILYKIVTYRFVNDSLPD